MSGVLANLKPENVFNYFEALSEIPRESGNEKGVSDYLVNFAKEHGLEYIQEDCLNVIINKPGTAGYENAPRVILQGHMDMVCVKKDEIEFDFNTQGIPLVVDGDFVRTEGTTLGADNGIAVAMAMAVLASNDLPHPPLSVLITVAEETGMDGVLGLNPENISGDILINMDSEEEGTALCSCAGGVRSVVKLPVEKSALDKADKVAYKLVISGLLGGHSGIEINKDRANSNKLLGRVLEAAMNDVELEVATISGGDKMNAISKYAEAVIVVGESSVAKFEEVVKTCDETFKNEYPVSDPDVALTLEKVELPEYVLSRRTIVSAKNILRLIPFGVQTMSASIKGLVESSSNIGVLRTTDEFITFESAIRSSVKSLKKEIQARVGLIAELNGATMELQADYPEWQFKVESKIRDLMKDVYKNLNGEELKIDAIHAGLECGFLTEKLGDIDMISIGPNMADVHTPNEHISISSVERVYNFLVAVLKEIK